MPNPTIVEVEKTAASTDIFNGTDLDQPKSNGVLMVWAASTVNTATLECPQDGHDPGKTCLLRKRADGIPSINDDPAFVIGIQQGKRPVLVLGGTTGTCHFTGKFIPTA